MLEVAYYSCGCTWDHGTFYPCAAHLAQGLSPDDEPEPDETQALTVEEEACRA